MANYYQATRQTIPIGAIYEANVYGKFVAILTWASITDLLISIDGQAFSPVKAGMAIRLPDNSKAFYNIKFWNVTGGIMALEYAVSDGAIVDTRFNVAGVIPVIMPGTAVVPAYGLVPCLAAAGGSLVIPANAARRSILIQNLIGNAGNMYIGFDALLTNINYGVLLVPGAIYTTSDYTGDVWAQAVVNLENCNFIEN
jgi:hypothetical protein